VTHTLHRVGSEESLAKDYVFLIMPSTGINVEGSGPKMQRFLEKALQLGAIKVGDGKGGNHYLQGISVEEMIARVQDHAVCHVVFYDRAKAVAMMQWLREADLGLSVVCSGLLDEVHSCCREAGIERHTVEHSLGRWGRTDLLPEGGVLELNTMCGHGMVTVGLIEKMVDEVRKGRLTATEAAEKLFVPCVCGVFNTARAAEILTDLADRS
jgi:hypothetical protein